MHSLNPVLVADDERCYVDANTAASLFLRLPVEEICKLRIDDLTPPHRRARLDAMWSRFLDGELSSESGQMVPWDLQMPDGAVVAADLKSTPYFQPGRHLAIIVFPPLRARDQRADDRKAPRGTVLTAREREILTLVALGKTGIEIADQLFLAPATVATHVTNALIKLNARNRAHGIAIALQTGELVGARSAAQVPAVLHTVAQRQARRGRRG